MIDRRRVAGAVWLAALATAAAAQDPSTVREEVRVRLRVVDFLALDGRGRPVSDLRRDEIRVWEGGDEQRLLDFFGPDLAAPTAPSPTAGEEPAAPGASSHRAVPPRAAPPRGRWIVLLIDAAHLSMQGRMLAGAALADLVEKDLSDSDRIFLLVNDDELRIVAPVGTPRSVLARQLRAAEGLSSMQRDMERRLRDLSQGTEDCREARDRAACARQATDEYLAETTRETSLGLDRLEALVRSLSAIPERKLLFYASEGLVADPGDVASAAIEHAIGQLGYNVNAMRLLVARDLRQRLDRVYQLASSSRTAFYPINTLRRMTGSDTFDAEHGFDYGPENQPQARTDPYDATWSQVSSLHRELARSTGGVPLFRHDPAGEVSRLLEAARGQYTLNYELASGTAPAKRVRLDCSRKGVKLLYREAFRAEPQDAFALDGELLVGEEAAPSRQPGVLMARLRVLGTRFAVAPASVPETSLAAVFFQVLGGDRAPRASHFEIIAFPRDTSGEGGRFLERPFAVKLPPGDYTLRAEVRDINGGGRASFEREMRIDAQASRVVGSTP